jgi:protein disulfide-isomerase-like protein
MRTVLKLLLSIAILNNHFCLLPQVGAAVEKHETPKSLGLDVVELNSRNFDLSVRDGNVWLVEFMTPWCSHCQQFASSYTSIAVSFHSSSKENIRVAKVDCQNERALTTRFGIQSFPSFYVVQGWSVYKYEGSRSVHQLMDFARGGYKKQSVSRVKNSA